MRFTVWERVDETYYGGWDFTSVGCELLRSHGEVSTTEQHPGQEVEASAQFLVLLPDADAVLMSPWHRPRRRLGTGCVR
jgi:hypothetical protein